MAARRPVHRLRLESGRRRPAADRPRRHGALDRHLRPVGRGRPARRRRSICSRGRARGRRPASIAAASICGGGAAGLGDARRRRRPRRRRSASSSPISASRTNGTRPSTRRISAAIARLSGAARRRRPRLLLWPEAATPDFLSIEPRARRRIAAPARAPATCCCSAASSCSSAPDGRANGAYNSLYALDPAGRLRGRYDKAHLVPYGEYLPMRPLLSALGVSRLAPGDLDFLCGPGPRTLDLPGFGRAGRADLLRDHLLRPGRRSAPTGPTSSSTPRTTPGSAPGARRSISPRRGCARSRKGCR